MLWNAMANGANQTIDQSWLVFMNDTQMVSFIDNSEQPNKNTTQKKLSYL